MHSSSPALQQVGAQIKTVMSLELRCTRFCMQLIKLKNSTNKTNTNTNHHPTHPAGAVTYLGITSNIVAKGQNYMFTPPNMKQSALYVTQ